MLRLQQILLLRDLGLDLATIGAVLDAEHDPIEALRRVGTGEHRTGLPVDAGLAGSRLQINVL